MIERALAMAKAVHGEDHPETQSIQEMLSDLYEDLGKFDDKDRLMSNNETEAVSKWKPVEKLEPVGKLTGAEKALVKKVATCSRGMQVIPCAGCPEWLSHSMECLE